MNAGPNYVPADDGQAARNARRMICDEERIQKVSTHGSRAALCLPPLRPYTPPGHGRAITGTLGVAETIDRRDDQAPTPTPLGLVTPRDLTSACYARSSGLTRPLSCAR